MFSIRIELKFVWLFRIIFIHEHIKDGESAVHFLQCASINCWRAAQSAPPSNTASGITTKVGSGSFWKVAIPFKLLLP